MNIRPPGPEQGPLVPQQRASDAVREARRAPAAGSRPVKRTKPGRASEIRSGGGVHRATERPLLSYARSAAELGAQAVRGLARSSTELGSRIANSPARYARLLLAGDPREHAPTGNLLTVDGGLGFEYYQDRVQLDQPTPEGTLYGAPAHPDSPV